ncbi:hypothetical protein AQJ30_17395 [Streptomyces longwoodensis]|uniref:Uncharacterized protein n=1 Tax=Streptomyces longwoodensis TaxID=68231 RepID=A0A101QWP7_9ACTN|nr:hypothetical protein AQJ30_17395 [Streptomyces longwoodensis]
MTHRSSRSARARHAKYRGLPPTYPPQVPVLVCRRGGIGDPPERTGVRTAAGYEHAAAPGDEEFVIGHRGISMCCWMLLSGLRRTRGA